MPIEMYSLIKRLQTILISLFLGIGQVVLVAHATEVKLTASDAAAGDEFGISSISGDYAIVGAYADDDAGDKSGSAYIFYRNQGGSNNNWGQQAKLTASDAAADDQFGTSVSISGDYAIVGAYADDDAGDRSGSAYIFYRNEGGSNNWGQQAKLTASDAAAEDYFGCSVSISGDYAIVGASGLDAYLGGDRPGSAYIFYRNKGGSNNWGQQAKLTTSDAAIDRFGTSASISGYYIIVGAPGELYTAGGDRPGSAYIFEKPVDGWQNMTETAKLTASDAAIGDRFGLSVSVSGDYAIVGASYNDDAGDGSGSAYIYYRDEGGNWGQQAKLTASDAGARDWFGCSVSISGDYVIVGAYHNDGAGSAYSFLRSGSSWSQKAKVTASDVAANDCFGSSVSINGNYTIVGAHNDDHSGKSNAGSAYIYHSIDDLSLPVELSLFTATTTSSDNVILKWRTETETDNVGFSIYKSDEEDGIYTEIAFVKGSSNSGMPNDYQFIDKSVEAGKTYFYYLEDIDITGEKSKSGIIKVLVSPVVTWGGMKRTALLQNFPNPFYGLEEIYSVN